MERNNKAVPIGQVMNQLQIKIEESPQAPVRSLIHSEMTSLTPVEKDIIQKKYAAPPIRELSLNNLYTFARLHLVKISVITGWPITTDEFLQKILIDQFAKILMEEYPTINVEEIEYAFRKYCAEVKNFGSELSLSLVTQVLDNYMKERARVSKVEELKSLPFETAAELPDEEFISMIYAWYQWKGWTAIPATAYDVLERMGELQLSRDEKFAALDEMEGLHNTRSKLLVKSFVVKKYFDLNPQKYDTPQ